MSIVKRTTAVLAALATLLVVVTASASAQDQPTEKLTREELGLEVVTGFAGVAAHRGTWTPVEVVLAPNRVIAGTLTVTANSQGAATVESRAVEIASGAQKVFRFVVPPSDDIVVTFNAPDRAPLSVRVAQGQDGPAFAVGVLDRDVPRGAPPAVAYATALRGGYARIDGAWLERSAHAMDEIGTLVASREALDSLSEVARRNLVTAVANGLELVVEVADASDADLSTLGLPWQPTTAATPATAQVVRGANGTPSPESITRLTPGPDAWGLTVADALSGSSDDVIVAAMAAGRGRVATVGVVLGEGVLGTSGELWQHLLQPSALTADGFSDSGRDLYVAQQAVRDPSLSVPSIPGLTVFLIAFVLLVGPLNGFVLGRMGRRELAWLTVPAITLVFAGVAFISATRTAPATGLTGTAAWWLDGVGTELQATVVRAPNPGVHDVLLAGEGWDVRNGSFGRPATVDRSTGDVAVRFQLESLELGTLLASRPTTALPPLTLTTEIGSDGIVATITNTSTEPVENVWLRAATARRRVGDLAPGGSESVTISAKTDTIPVVNAWMEQFAGMRDSEGRVVPPMALEELLRWTVVDGTPGTVWVTGTVASAASVGPLAIADGTPSNDIGALVAVGSTLRGAPAAATPFGVQRTLLAESRFGALNRSSPTAVQGQGEVALRYRLPKGDDVTTLTATLNRGQLENGGGFRGPEGPVECSTREVVNPNDGQVTTQELCIEVGVPEPEGLCPPEAFTCFVSRFQVEACSNFGGCTTTFIDDENLVRTDGLEVYDHVARVWVPTDLAFPGGSGDPAAYLSPLGEVYVRMSGQFQPFDYSGRGVAANGGQA